MVERSRGRKATRWARREERTAQASVSFKPSLRGIFHALGLRFALRISCRCSLTRTPQMILQPELNRFCSLAAARLERKLVRERWQQSAEASAFYLNLCIIACITKYSLLCKMGTSILNYQACIENWTALPLY